MGGKFSLFSVFLTAAESRAKAVRYALAGRG
jgi:hypothetical protein